MSIIAGNLDLHVECRPRVGCFDGHSPRLNERVIDDQWTGYLAEYTELIRIPPVRFAKIFGGSLRQFSKQPMSSLPQASERLARLGEEYGIDTLYVNAPYFMPFLMLVRSFAKLPLRFMVIAHSIASARWLTTWLSCAPWITEQDVLLASTESCRQALVNLSPRYAHAYKIPLCIDTLLAAEPVRPLAGKRLLSIGRLEEVKNIHVLLEAMAEIKQRVPDTVLTIAGEYTGSLQEADRYKERLEAIVAEYRLEQTVEFTGPVHGSEKDRLFRESRLLVNLSTDPGETFGFNLLEAKAHGLPVVCTNWDGFRELLVDGEDGSFVQVDWSGEHPKIDLDGLVRSCTEVLLDDKLHDNLSQGARRNALMYDYRTIMPQIRRLLNAPLGQIAGEAEETALLEASMRTLNEIYHCSLLEATGCLSESPLSVLDWQPPGDTEEWMRRVKPLIQHFAGRNHHAHV